MPVLSLVTDLTGFSCESVYVPGDRYVKVTSAGCYWTSGLKWEQEAHLEFFESDGHLALPRVGIRIHGLPRPILKTLNLRSPGIWPYPSTLLLWYDVGFEVLLLGAMICAAPL